MRKYILLSFIFVLLLIYCCSKKDSPVSPVTEDWTYPNSSKFSITLFSDKQSVSVGENFDVKLLAYNINEVLAAAFEINYNSTKIEISDILSGPYFASDNNVVIFKKIEPDSNRISYGISYKMSANKMATGSGVVIKIKCKAKLAGTGTLVINSQKLEIRDLSGGLISNLTSLQIENFTITIK